MNQEQELEFKKAAEEALDSVCFRDEHGNFYTEIYADYRDELDDRTFKKICNAENPRWAFYDWLDEAYQECVWDYEDQVIKEALEDEDFAKIASKLDEDEVRDHLRDMFYVKLPEKHFLDQDILVDILVDTGDLNYDYTLNNFGPHYDARENEPIPEESSLLWLARQQGYTKTQLKQAMRERPAEKNFMQSVYDEINNVGSHMNTLTFLVKMSLEEYFYLTDAIGKERERNQSYTLNGRKGRGWILLDKTTTAGLYDPWSGGGSLLEIRLDKDVRLPIRCIETAKHDGCRGYSIREIYCCCTSLWTETLKEIHPMKKIA
ncbi:MAG: hypothetical protein IJH79_14685 [Lentisphaeria bacterium]|nr:hypothetical protein [Lentisphaeria bacterium]